MKSLSIRLASTILPLLRNPRGEPRLSILIYHRVMSRRDEMRPDEPTQSEFDWQMRLLREHFHPLPLIEAVERHAAGELPPRAVCVTFDDGYADNEQLALPIFKRYEIPATVFISTGYLNGGRMWNDTVIEALRAHPDGEIDLSVLNLPRYTLGSVSNRREAAQDVLLKIKHLDPQQRQKIVDAIASRCEQLPDDLMMTDAQVYSLANAGIEIGAHTVSHPILSSVSPKAALLEISESKSYLQNLTGRKVNAFAYPNGLPARDYGPEHRAMVGELGFQAAVSTHWGVATERSDRLQLPRFTPWDRTPLRFAARLLLNQGLIDPLVDT